MNIAFYYNNSGLFGIDYSKVEYFNPGVGGTQYMMMQLAVYLNRLYRTKINLVLYYLEDSLFPNDLNIIKVSGLQEALDDSCRSGIDFFVMNHVVDRTSFEIVESSKSKIIFWGHNYYFSDLANWISKTDSIVANVFVGKQQYDRYIDHSLCAKSYVIHNMIADYFKDVNRTLGNDVVTYIGALIPSKGFLELAKMWKKILHEKPNAKLKIIGTGNVYSRTNKLGPLGLADEEYENQFIPYLSDTKTGKLLDSVEFLGMLGETKYKVFEESKVGVVNPTARTEIFSISIMEMAIMTLPVVTLNRNGFPDSIIDGESGYLCNSSSDIVRKILVLLTDEGKNRELGSNAKIYMNNFSPEKISKKWVDLFDSLSNNVICPYLGYSKPLSNNCKYLRVFIRVLRMNLKIKCLPSLIEIETAVYKMLRNIKK